MLSIAELSVESLQISPLSSHSPSKHPFMKRVQQSRFSFDPYKTVRPTSPSRAYAAPRSSSVESQEATIVTTVKTVVSTTTRYALVAFKQGSADIRAPFRVTVGDLVVVEGDRGEHIGTVKAITTEVPADPIASKILRRASAADREAYEAKVEKERVATEEISKIAVDVRLNATVIDVEYQFDMNKLTIFVERATATTFVDFRKLQRTLFRQFHCRIWCAYMDEVKSVE